MESGLCDVFREKDKHNTHYTWWKYMGNAYANNTGWRIDYFIASRSLLPLISNQGSD